MKNMFYSIVIQRRRTKIGKTNHQVVLKFEGDIEVEEYSYAVDDY
jgi:hypothetical protein